MKNYYEILEINFTASLEEIKKAYRIKAIKYHPDKHSGDNYFVEKFLEVKEAFDNLSDPKKRSDYDIIYKTYFLKEDLKQKEIFTEVKREEQEREEQYFYDPYKPFYSYQDRIQQDTPQFIPKINHWGEPLNEDPDFFVLPKRIGKIISGYTTLPKNSRPSTNKSHYICNYIGVNGFAEFNCKGNKENVVSSTEINFNDITDLVNFSQVRKLNFSYMNTAFYFGWMNNLKSVHIVDSVHFNKQGNPERIYTNYWLNTFAEKYWTVYLLDRMESELENKGCLQFNLYYYDKGKYIQKPYVQLGVGYIKFTTFKENVVYKFDEISKVYVKDSILNIEHKNYEKKYLLFGSGNKNGIPLMYLGNRQFFFKSMELLIGYKLV